MVKKKAKRCLSLLLSLVMVMSLVVTPVYATGEEDQGSQTTSASETNEAASETNSDSGISLASEEDGTATTADATTDDTHWDVSEDQDASVIAYATVNSDGTTVTLHITGTGKMKDYSAANERPWHSSFKAVDGGDVTFSKEAVTAVVIESGVTKIGAYAFSSLMISHAVIPASVTEISTYAFSAARPGTGDDGKYLPVIVYMVGNTSYAPDSTSSEGNVILAYLNGGSLDSVTEFSTDGTLATPTLEGDTFGGWYRNSNFSGDAYEVGTKGKTYYAKWTNASAWDVSASDADNVRAYVTLNDDKETVTLHITGTGAMKDFEANTDRPWHTFTVSGSTATFGKEAITNIEISEGVTHIGKLAFCSTKVSSVVIPASVTSIGENAFAWVKGYTTDNTNYLTIVYLKGDTDWTLSDGETAYVAQAYLNGTAIDTETIPATNTLASTTLEGCTVLGWYDNTEASGNKIETAEAGKTYYACIEVAKIENIIYTSLQSAIKAATENETITLLADVSVDSVISVTGTVNLDLNGNSITAAAGFTDYLFSVAAAGKLSISDNSTDGDGNITTTNRVIMVHSGGTVMVTGGTVHGDSIAIFSSGGTVNVSGGTVSCYGTSSNGTYTSYSAIYCDTTSGGSLSITGGEVSGYRGIINWGSTVTISGGTVSANSAACAIQQTGGNLVISGGEVTNTGTGQAVYISQGATATISGGSITAPYEGYGVGVLIQKGTLTMTGGTVYGHNFGIGTNGTDSTSYYPNTITISGGEVSGTFGMYLPAVGSTTTISGDAKITGTSTGIEIRAGELIVNGGTISSTSATFTTKTNGNGATTYGAGISISQHSTDKEVSVTINGGTISGYYGVYELNTYASKNTSDVTLTIPSTSTAVISSTDANNEDEVTGQAVYSASVSEGTYAYTTIVISGGSFSSKVADAYCAEGYEPTTVDEDGCYTVTLENAAKVTVGNTTTYYKTLAAAITAANTLTSTDADSVIVTMLADATYSETQTQLSIDTTIPFVLEMNGYNITFESTYSYLKFATTCTGDVTIQNSAASGGTISNTSTNNGGCYAVYLQGSATTGSSSAVTLKGLTLYSATIYAIYYNNLAAGSSMTIEDCTISTGSTSYASLYHNRGTLTVKSGTIVGTLKVNPLYENVTLGSEDGVLTIDTVTIAYAGDGFAIVSGTYGSISGTITDASKIDSQTAVILGVSSCVLPAGYQWVAEVIDEDTTKYVIREVTADTEGVVAKITYVDGSEVYCADWTSAVNGVANGSTLTLLAEYNETSQISIKNVYNVTIDLNGHNMTSTGTNAIYYSISSNYGNNMTVTIKNSAYNSSNADETTSRITGKTYGINLATGYSYGTSTTNAANDVKLVVEDGVTISGSTNAVYLGVGTYMAYDDTAKSLITSGGFLVSVEGETNQRIYGILNYAVRAAEAGGTVTLANDYSGTTMLMTGTFGKNFTLNLDSHTWTYTASGYSYSYKYAAQISETIDVTIQNGTITTTGNYVGGITIYSSSTCQANLTLSNVTMNLTGSSGNFAISTNGTTGNKHTVVIKDTTINAAGCGYGVYFPSEGSLTVENSSITGAQATGIEIRAGSLTVMNSTISSSAATFYTENNGSGTTVVGAGIAVSQHTTNREITVNITDSEITGYYGIYEINYNSSKNTSPVTINITETEDATKPTVVKATGDGAAAVYSVSISGTEDESITATTNSITTIAISGGHFSTNLADTPEYIADGYASFTETDTETYAGKLYTVDAAVASITVDGVTIGYLTFADALEAAEDGQTITLLADVSVTEETTISKSVTLDLNGNNFTVGSSDDTAPVALTIAEGAEVSIVDSSVGATGIVYNYGTITVNGSLDISSLGYTTDAETSGGLYGKTSGKISMGASGTFAVPSVWATQWSSLGEWSPNWTSATSSSGIFTSAAVGATVICDGTTWTCVTEFKATEYVSDITYWSTAKFYGASLNLDGTIGVNFYVDLNDVDDSEKEYYTMSFTVAGTTSDASYVEGNTITSGGKTYQRYTVYVNSIQMAKTIIAKLNYNGKTIDTYEYSVQSYCRRMLQKNSTSAELKALCAALLNYGGYAQINFDSDTENLANANLNEYYTDWSDPVTDGTWENSYVSRYAGEMSDTCPSGISVYGAQLDLGSETTIRIFFNYTGEDDISTITFTFAGKEITPIEKDGGENYNYCIEYDVPSNKLSTMYTLTVTDGTDTYTMTYGALTFGYNMLNKEGTTDELKNVVKALYYYSKAADDYFNK